MFRLSTCLLFGSVEALGSDETSLMQGLKPVQDLKNRRQDKSAVTSLLESAKGMLKSGETQEVTAFALETLQEISSQVLPAIIHSSEADQRFVNGEWHLFQRALDELQEGLRDLEGIHQRHLDLNRDHAECRHHERLACETKVHDDYVCMDHWRTCADYEANLRLIARDIDGHFCIPPANGTDDYFRGQAVLKFEPWDHAVDLSLGCLTDYERPLQHGSCTLHDMRGPTIGMHPHGRAQCEDSYSCLVDRSDQCNTLKGQLEEIACEHASLALEVRSRFECAWQHAIESYDRAEKAVRVDQRDRVREWRHLSTVECLLEETTSRNGRPCDEETGEFDGIAARCEEAWKSSKHTNEILRWLIHFPCEERQCSDGSVGIGPHMDADGADNTGCDGPLTCPSVSPACGYRDYSHAHLTIVSPPCELDILPLEDWNTDGTELEGTCHPWYVEGHRLFETPDFFLPTLACTGTMGAESPDGPNRIRECGQTVLEYHQTCVPQDVAAPCSSQFHELEYGNLTTRDPHDTLFDFIPEADFFWRSSMLHGGADDRNSHCFPEEPCVTCMLPIVEKCTLTSTPAPPTLPPTPEPVTTTALPDDCGDHIPELVNAEWVHSLVPGVLRYRCAAGFSFNGLSCGTDTLQLECLSTGRYSQVRQCLPIDDCEDHTCGPFGVCVDAHMDYNCECAPGFTETEIEGEKVCGNEDDCHRSTCGAGGLCVDLIQDYNCDCHEGWTETPTPDGGKTCSRVECGHAPEVDNVAVGGQAGTLYPWSRGKAVYGDIIEYDCLTGYTTDGTHHGAMGFTITCQHDGTYSETQECLPVSCGTPEPFGQSNPASSDEVHFGQEVVYTCPEGFGPDSFVRSCEATGELSPPIACEPKLCPGVPVFPMASMTTDNSLYFFGQTADFSCDEGYSTNPSDPSARNFRVECMADGWATGVGGCQPVACTFTPDETHRLTEPIVLQYAIFGPRNLIRCADDYTLSGSAEGAKNHVATCGADGRHDIPSCVMVVCPAESLQTCLYSTARAPAERQVGETVTYDCDDGYAVIGSTSTSFEVECQSDGYFSAMRTCRNIDDCIDHTCGSNGRCVDGINDFSCDCEDGFEEITNEAGEKICGNIDDCGPRACGGHGVCHDQTNGYQCECDDGYFIPEADSQNEDRICVARQCSLEHLENVVTFDGMTSIAYTEVLNISCMTGFTAGEDLHQFVVGCGADGELRYESYLSVRRDIPECRPVECGVAPQVDYTSSPDEQQNHVYFFGDQFVGPIFTCTGGDVTIEYDCQADGTFTIVSEHSSCENSCGEPQVPARAHRLDGVGEVIHPSSTRWACNEGFTHGAEGDVSQVCKPTGEFEDLFSALGDRQMPTDVDGNPACRPVQCELPIAPETWQWTADTAASDFNFLNSASLRCVEGYEFNGATGAASQVEVSCNADGTASPLPAACQLTTYRLSGRIRSALDPDILIAGALIQVRSTTNDDTFSITSGGSGQYELIMRPGNYVCTISADGYITNEFIVTNFLDDSIGYDLNLSPLLGENEWRFVLTWNEFPQDLDSHFVFWGDEDVCREMYFRRRSASCGGVSAHLDVDDETGYGPETTTISDINLCGVGLRRNRDCKRWVYRVKHYSATYTYRYPLLYTNPHGWATSGALVTLYNGDHVVNEYNVNEHGYTTDDGTGGGEFKFWSVVALTSEGEAEVCTNENCDP